MPTPINLTGPAYSGPSVDINAQECVNMFVHIDQNEGRTVRSLLGRYGLDLFSTVGASAIRGIFSAGDTAIVVSGDVLYSVDNSGTVTEKTPHLDTSTGRVGMASNGTQIMIVDGTSGYIYTLASGTLAKIADADFGGGNDVTFVDGYFIVDNLTGGTMQQSALLDGTSWDATEKATPEADPDGLVRCMNVHGVLMAFGSFTTEPWYNAANPTGFSFLRMQSSVINMGLASRWGAVEADNTAYWLAQNKEGLYGIVRLSGNSAEKISTVALDKEIQGYSTVLDCAAWAMTTNGHTFIYFDFPTAGKTWVYDSSTGTWSEARTWQSTTGFHPAFHMFFNNQHVLGDKSIGKLYTVNWDTYEDNGEIIERIRVAQHISANGLPLEINEFQLLCETGVGPAEESGDPEPMVLLSWSKDGGRIFSSDLERSLGWQGEYDKRVLWHCLGTNYKWTFRIRETGNFKTVIMGALANPVTGVE